MHLVENEEGNFLSHGHHNHTSQDHMMNGTSEKKDESIALLKYMLEHNQHHARELDELADKVQLDGNMEVVEEIKLGVSAYDRGNKYLESALKKMQHNL